MTQYLRLLVFIFFCGCTNDSSHLDNSSDSIPDNSLEPFVDLNKTTPLDFLKGLKLNKLSLADPVVCNSAPDDWITKSDIPKLLPYLDSNDIAARPVFNSIASFTLGDHGQSTLANEAYCLIRGYRFGGYPPLWTTSGGLNDTYKLEDTLKQEILNWWTTEGQK